MKTGTLLLSIALCLPTAPRLGQGGTTDAWPTYAGDYSQRRYSPLRQIDQTNVRHLTLAWLRRLTAGPGGGEGAWFGPPPGPPAITGGVPEEPMTMPGATSGAPRLLGHTAGEGGRPGRAEERTTGLQSHVNIVFGLPLEQKEMPVIERE